ncbi:MAG: hypothetical protein H0W89_07510 [Candidatus Levybacteria bacterium]|nr:hypothetical protein [Candidatus Levybacteria bacterium]
MQDSALFDHITEKIRLKSEMTAVFICLEDFTSNFFAPKNDDEMQRVFDNLPPALAQVMKDSYLQEPVTHENQSLVHKHVEDLKDKLRTLRVVQLTLAFQPNEEAIAIFSDWVKKNITVDTIIDLQFDKTIVGGALLIADGQYKDYSVRKKLAGRFQIQRDEIVGLLS